MKLKQATLLAIIGIIMLIALLLINVILQFSAVEYEILITWYRVCDFIYIAAWTLILFFFVKLFKNQK